MRWGKVFRLFFMIDHTLSFVLFEKDLKFLEQISHPDFLKKNIASKPLSCVIEMSLLQILAWQATA